MKEAERPRGRECGAKRGRLSCVLRPHLTGFHVGSSPSGLTTWRDGEPKGAMTPKTWTESAAEAAEVAHASLREQGEEAVAWADLSLADRELRLEVAMAVEDIMTGGREAPPIDHEPLGAFARAVHLALCAAVEARPLLA